MPQSLKVIYSEDPAALQAAAARVRIVDCSHDLATQFAHSLHGKRVINRQCALFMYDDSAIDHNGRHITSTGSGNDCNVWVEHGSKGR